ncbi:MAG: RsmB/NOP family class I SAM-dependent RNA methyltransferase, partial [Candidatus Bathyarchaeia archaeon]
MLREAWTIAIETLSWMEIRRLNERSALMRTIKQLNTKDPQAIRLSYGLVVETTRRKNLIDKLVNDVVFPKNICEFDQGVQAFLRLYVYQTRVTKNWGKYNLKEAENIARLGRSILGWKAMRDIEPFLGFLLTRQLTPIIDASPVAEKIGLQTYNPIWFVEYCFKHFGKKEAVAFLQGSLNPPPIYIRINTLRGVENEIVEKLESEGIKLEKVELLKYTYKVVESKTTLNNSPSLKKGLFYVQDKASCFATQAANPQPENIVLDICAAPGAKTTFLAQLMDNAGSITSMDFSTKRMRTWQKEIIRMGAKNANPIIADARASIPVMEKADSLVLDPPCTSSGVFAKQPSAKWRLSPKSIHNMS